SFALDRAGVTVFKTPYSEVGVQRTRTISTALALYASIAAVGCNQAEKKLAHEMKVFGLAYHQMAQGGGQLFVDEEGHAKIDWKGRPGPGKLEDMAAVESEFPELAKRIRAGTFVVVWKARFLPTAEENSKYFLGHDLGIEEKGGWVLRADGWAEKI